MHQFLPYAWFGGRCVPFAEATLSVATHALHYGTGAFGGMRALPNPSDPGEILLFRADRHARRLSQSARLLLTELSEETIHSAIHQFLQANRPSCPVYLRPFVYTSDLGIAPRLHNIETDFLIYGLELGDYLSPEGVSCRISSWTRQEDRSLPLRGKISGAYITSSLAKTEAVKSGFDEALLLNSRGKVSEASGMNLFLVRDGVLITPGVDQDILGHHPRQCARTGPGHGHPHPGTPRRQERAVHRRRGVPQRHRRQGHAGAAGGNHRPQQRAAGDERHPRAPHGDHRGPRSRL